MILQTQSKQYSEQPLIVSENYVGNIYSIIFKREVL